MKIKKFNESGFIPSNDEEMENFIYDIIENELSIRQILYSVDDAESISKNIIIELKKLGVDFDLIYSAKKYNL
jgi:predicted transcriptional regulator